MRRCFAVQILLAGLLLLLLSSGLGAANKIAIDGIHGVIQPESYMFNPNLDSLYPEVQFTRFDANRLPIYNLLAEGVLDGVNGVDTIEVDVPAGAHALYVTVDCGIVEYQYPIAHIVRPDSEVVEGAYGNCHIDDPEAGHYLVQVIYSYPGHTYRIGTGPYIWEVYPLTDYDAVLDLHSWLWFFFTGEPTPRSPTDWNYLQPMLNAGGSVGLFYDGAEPIAMKPIIRMRDMAREGAAISLHLPATVTYAVPQPDKAQPLTWTVAPTTAEKEFDYEAKFHQHLNFVSFGSTEGSLTNRSWATVHDLKVIECVRGQGYRVEELGTLKPEENIGMGNGAVYSYREACAVLDRLLRSEAREAGLTAEETESFFGTYHWPERLLPYSCKEGGLLVLYRIEGEDYDGLFPLSADPLPAEMCRVLWVYSFVSDQVRDVCPVHPRREAAPCTATRRTGSYHEYGFFRERYGGGSLDDWNEWDWHFTDNVLIDSTDHAEFRDQILFHQWGASPLTTRLSAGVTTVQGLMSGGIVPAAGTAEVVLHGDEDTQTYGSENPFPPGSFPPVLVARDLPAGGHLAGASDFAFFGGMADNTQLMRNLFSWMSEGACGEGPDIDLPTAVITGEVMQGGTASSGYYIYNRGNQPLTFLATFPEETWIGITGPASATIQPGDSASYTLHWSGNDLTPGYYRTWWMFTTNDTNEAVVQWPLRLKVIDVQPADPNAGRHMPAGFSLLPPSPNPFNANTKVTLILDHAGKLALDLYNILGERVECISDQVQAAGTHRIILDMSRHSAGIYFLQARFEDHSAFQKLVLLK